MQELANISQTIVLFFPTIYASAVYESYKLRNEPLALLMIAIVFYDPLISAAFFAHWGGRFLLYFFPLRAYYHALKPGSDVDTPNSPK